MASSPKKESEEANTWDSDIEVSSDDDDDDDKTESQQKRKPKPKPPSKPPSKPPLKASRVESNDNDNDDEKKRNEDPMHLKLTLFDSYNQSKIYNKIRKRRIQKRLNDNDDNNDNDEKIEKTTLKNSDKKKTKTISDLKSHRILYEMSNYEYKWYWIDSLPTDDINDYLWIQQYSNINLFQYELKEKEEKKEEEEEDEEEEEEEEKKEYIDIEDAINNNNMIERVSISDFEHNLNESRKSVINSPLFPELGCCGYCKEFYVTLCDWNAEGVLSIKYISDESQRSLSENKSLKTCNGYWQKLRYQVSISNNSKYIAILFDRYCIIRYYKNRYSTDLYRIKLPISFWEYTQFRYIKWSENNELLAISSFNNDIIIYAANNNNRFDEILAFNTNRNNKNNNIKISGLIWRKKKKNNNNDNNYWLDLIILYENGELHQKGILINNERKQVIDFEDNIRIKNIQFPHNKITKWIYDGINYYYDDDDDDNDNDGYMVISCLPLKLLDTKPRQTRLGNGIMILKFNDIDNEIIVFKYYNSMIPSNSWFKVDSVCFTMADRRAKIYGRDINIAPNGKHILCLDLRGNMELFAFNNDDNNDDNNDEFELIAKIGNTREMSYGSYPSHSRIYSMKWWDNESIIILFCNNTFCITPIKVISYYNQRDMKWSINYLGPQREQLYGLPIISNTVKNIINNNNDNNDINIDEELKMFFILEISEAYLRRKDDEHLKYINNPTNDIDKQQNEIYGFI